MQQDDPPAPAPTEGENTVSLPDNASVSPAPLPTPSPAPLQPLTAKGTQEGNTQGQRPSTRNAKPRRNASSARLTRRRAKCREYHARLVRQGKTAQAAAYRELHRDAWPLETQTETQSQQGAQAGAQAGGEGVAPPPFRVKPRNQPRELNIVDKGVSVMAREMSAELRNEIIGLIDNRVKEIIEAREEGRVEVKEEVPVYYEKEEVVVVWHGDPEGTVEAEVVGAPRNVRIRQIEIGGVQERMWVLPGMPPMVGWKVAVKPHLIEGEGGYTLVGSYGRKGARIG